MASSPVPWATAHPALGAAAVTIVYALQATATLVEVQAVRLLLHVLAAGGLWLGVGLPFLALLLRIISTSIRRVRLAGWYYVYLFYALQVMMASTVLALAQFDRHAYRGLCPPHGGGCTNPWQQSLRALYFVAGSFASVGYGDIVPVSTMAILFSFPQFWFSGLYFSLVIGRITARVLE